MFLEKLNYDSKILIKLDTGAHLSLLGRTVYYHGYHNFHEVIYEGDRRTAEAVYENLKKQWVGNNLLQTIRFNA